MRQHQTYDDGGDIPIWWQSGVRIPHLIGHHDKVYCCSPSSRSSSLVSLLTHVYPSAIVVAAMISVRVVARQLQTSMVPLESMYVHMVPL